MKTQSTFRRLAALSAALFLTACGVAPHNLPVSPRALDSVDGLATESGIAVAFNNTYKERIDLNEPIARKDPKNTDKALLRLIKGAKTSIDGAFYDIEDLGVADELVRAKKRGVAVRLVTDTDNMVEKSDPTQPRKAITWLKAVKVPVVDDQRSGIMHHKFMVVDGKTVWTGSTNLTPTSLYCHNNNALTLRVPELANAFSSEFERMFTKREFGKSQRGETRPTERISLGAGASVQAFFSPGGSGRAAVTEELTKAKKSIRFLTFSLTDIETGGAMLARASAGIKVEGVFDRWLAAGQYSLFPKFQTAKLEVRKDGNEALMHHKVIVVDESTVITGSYNYSQNAEEHNNEAFLIFRGSAKLAKAYTGEYERVRYASIHNHPPAHKPITDPENKTGGQP